MIHKDPLRFTLWSLSGLLFLSALIARHSELWPSTRSVIGPFGILTAVIIFGLVLDRLGVFRFMAGILLPKRIPPSPAFAILLVFTAVVSGLVNIDVAVVVAMPLALEISLDQHLPAQPLALSIAITANSASFLLPTSNLTTLLVLSRSSIPAVSYVKESWLPWILVVTLTIGALCLALGKSKGPRATRAAKQHALAISMLLDLLPMFIAAAAVRALFDGSLDLAWRLSRSARNR